MRVFAKVFIVCWMTIYADVAGAAFEYNGMYMYGGSVNINENVLFDSDSVMDNTTFNIRESVLITNNGDINTYVNLCPGCSVFIRNSGVFNILNEVPADQIFQVIESPDDITSIGINGSFNIIARGQYEIPMSKLMAIAESANSLILNDSILVMDAPYNPDVPIILNGNISVLLPSVDIVKSGPILQNVDGDGIVLVYAPNIDKLYTLESYMADGNVYGHLVRETDYYKILENDTGKFLNALRDIVPDDKLLNALDSAETMTDINSIMERSSRLHPINLMRSIRVMREYDTMGFYNSTVGNVGASAFAIRSNKIKGHGINAEFTIMASDSVSIGASGYWAKGSVNDDLDEYGFVAYGGRVHINYDDGHILADGDVGTTIANFEIGPTIVGTDPRGTMRYAGIRGGYRFNITKPITFIPFVGINGDISHIADERESGTAINTGFEMNIHNSYIGIGYDYGIRTMIDSADTVGVMARLGIDMYADATVFDIMAGVMHDDFTTSVRGTLQIRMLF